ncbi:GNAT family N-acetyltransferase [Roseivirga sp. BDSF3-8]|uniref:GNAT family N-acetyltransferase n=1 Tax=Roseivirga sp. BDSF3-8 TaxID=3241598 RepID=UPI0035325C06
MVRNENTSRTSSVKFAGKENLESIAKCQRRAFPASLSSAMGVTYLQKMLEWYIVQPTAFLFYLETEEGLCAAYCGGFVVDGSLETGSASGMLQHSFNQAVRAFVVRPWLVLHKEMRAKASFTLRNVRRRLGLVDQRGEKMISADIPQPAEPYTGLVVIGTDPAYRGKGYGTLLLKEFEEISKQKGVKLMRLTVNAFNHQAIKSYKRNGWVTVIEKNKALVMEKKI